MIGEVLSVEAKYVNEVSKGQAMCWNTQDKTFIETDCLSECEFRSNSMEIFEVLVTP